MKKFFSENGIFILAVLAVVSMSLAIITALSSNTIFVQNFFGTIAKPFKVVASGIADFADNTIQHFEDVHQLQEENLELKERIAELENEVRDSEKNEKENQELRELLNFAQQREDLSLETATIIQESASNWSSTLTLNKGKNVGISQNNCVVDVYGNLVGVVTEVGSSWCMVTTILDPDSQIGALVFRTSSSCVASGRLSLLSKNELELNYLRDSQDILNGDLVVTSGLGGYYPSGLPIGSIVEVLPDDSGVYQYAVLSPSTDMESLRQVYIVTSFTKID